MIKRWCDSKGEGDATPGRMVREGLAEEGTSELGEESPWRGTARAEVQRLAYGKSSQEVSSASVTQAKGRAQGEVREVERVPWRCRNFTQRLASCLSLAIFSSVTLDKLFSFFVPRFVSSVEWG